MAGRATPLPPNRTSGSSACDFPVSEVSARRIISTGATLQTTTPGASSLRQTVPKAACRLRSDSTLSQSRNHLVVGSLCSSRISMRSVHIEGSTPPTVADVCAFCRQPPLCHCRRSIPFVIRHRLHASTSLRPLAPRALPRLLATPDALTPAGRLFGLLGHEHRSGPGGSPCLSRPHFPPFRPQPLAAPAPAFAPVHTSCLLVAASQKTLPAGRGTTSPQGSWPGLGSPRKTRFAWVTFTPQAQARRSALLNRVDDRSRPTCHVVTDGSFTSGHSPPRVATTQSPSVPGR
jgi:hypothetical protein